MEQTNIFEIVYNNYDPIDMNCNWVQYFIDLLISPWEMWV